MNIHPGFISLKPRRSVATTSFLVLLVFPDLEINSFACDVVRINLIGSRQFGDGKLRQLDFYTMMCAPDAFMISDTGVGPLAIASSFLAQCES